MRAKLIGITGKAGSGKDTIADAAVAEFNAVKYNFALPIKEALNAMLGWKMEQWDDRVWKESPIDYLFNKSPRQLAQTLGTEWGRHLINPDFWTRLAMLRYQAYCDAGATQPFIIPDVRFDNEADAIHKMGGIVIEIIRPGVQSVNAHVSEAGVSKDKIDHVVYNDRAMERFVENAMRMLEEVGP